MKRKNGIANGNPEASDNDPDRHCNVPSSPVSLELRMWTNSVAKSADRKDIKLSDSNNQCHMPLSTKPFGSNSKQPKTFRFNGLEIFSECNPGKISSIFSSFGLQKAILVDNIGFGGLLKLPMSDILNLPLCLWLLSRVDMTNMCIHLNNGVNLHFHDPDVHLVLGIPLGNRPVCCNFNLNHDMVHMFGRKLHRLSSPPQFTASFLEEILTREYGSEMSTHDKEAFIIATVLYACIYLLDPQPNQQFPRYLMENFLSEVRPAELNWCQLVLSGLERASMSTMLQLSRQSQSFILLGCCLFLQVFYLDNLNWGPITPYQGLLPRASVYSNEVVAGMVSLDSAASSSNNFIEFGQTQVRCSHEVIYARGWKHHFSMLDQFEQFVPADYMHCIEVITQAKQLLDEFARHTIHINHPGNIQGTQSIRCAVNSYMAYNSKYNSIIGKLLKKGADYIKMRNMSLFPGYIHQYNHSDLKKKFVIGVSRHQIAKRKESYATLAPLLRTMENLGASSQCKLPLTTVLQGQVHCKASRQAQDLRESCHINLAGKDPHPDSASSNSLIACSQRKVVSSHSFFPTSPFQLKMKHEQVQSALKSRAFSWLCNVPFSSEQLNRDWVVFHAPKMLSLPGHLIYNCLKRDGFFTMSLMDAIMVVWTYEDELMYNSELTDGGKHRRWRHFLPASFAEMVIDDMDPLSSDNVRESFIGQHITYDIENCEQIVMPVLDQGGSWSCYFWDFKTKTTSVLDPVLMGSSKKTVRKKHASYVCKLHNSLFACIKNFFSGWNPDTIGWTHVYRPDLYTFCKRQNSGLYAVHFARAFNGSSLAFELRAPNEWTLDDARGELIYRLLTCPMNKALKETNLKEALNN